MRSTLVPNWRISLKASYQSGTVESNVSYGVLYNDDQFYTDGKGGVTYANGTPFLVPATPGTSISSLNSPVNPEHDHPERRADGAADDRDEWGQPTAAPTTHGRGDK